MVQGNGRGKSKRLLRVPETFDNTPNFVGHSEPVPDAEPEQLPAAITVKLAELYSEYIKPERFFQWLYEQEQRKRELAKQQLELELQRQHAITCAEILKFRNGWDRDCDKQLDGQHD